MAASGDTESEVVVYATSWCGDCRLAKRVLDEQQVPYRWIDIDADPSAAETVLRINGGYRTVPTILFPNGAVLVEPTRRAMEEALSDLTPTS